MGWEKVKLGDLCTIEKGKTGIQKAIPGNFPLVVTAEERKSHNEYQFDDEAVIIPLVSGTGHGHASIKRLHFQSGKFALGSILCAVIPKDKSVLNTEYLFRFLSLNKERELVSRMKGMANVTLPIKEIAKIEIPVPSIEEQIKFVEKYALLEVDNQGVSNEMEYQLELIKQLRQAFLREAMQGRFEFPQQPLTEALEGKGLETGHDLLAKIKAEKAKLIAEKKLKKEKELPSITEEEIPFEIPEHWTWCRLGEICSNIQTGLEKNKDFQSNDNSYLYFKMNNIGNFNGEEDWSSTIRINASDQELLIYSLKYGDFLFNTRNSRELVGKTCVFSSRFNDPVLFNNNIARINFILSNPFFINFWFITPNLRNILFEINSGVTNVAAIYLKQIVNLLIPLPPLHEQEQIVAKLEALMAFCDGLEQSIKESQGYNEMLLQQVLREALQGVEV